MITRYVSFGLAHLHLINNKVIDKDCVVRITGTSEVDCRLQAFELFDAKFSMIYNRDELHLNFYPRGIIGL